MHDLRGLSKGKAKLLLQLGQPREPNVTPVPKIPLAKSPSDSRPISVVAKVFESLVHTQLYSYLTTNSLLHPTQSGF